MANINVNMHQIESYATFVVIVLGVVVVVCLYQKITRVKCRLFCFVGDFVLTRSSGT